MENEKTCILHPRFLLRCAVMLAVMMTIPTVMSGALPDTTTVNGTHLYKINLAKNASASQYLSVYFITPSSPKVSIKDNPGADELWYILETDDAPTGTFERDHIEHYCYIVNAVSGQYLYYTGTNSNSIETDVVEMKDIDANGVENDRFKFIIKQSGNSSTVNYWMFPKIAAENNKFSGSTNLWESNSYGFLTLGIPQGSTYANGLTLSKERNGVWTSQWVFVSSLLIAAPTITFDSETNSFSISHNILSSGCTIYYTIDGSTPSTTSTQYTGPVVVNAPEIVKAVVIRDYNNILLTEVGSLEVAPVAVVAPTVTNNFDGTITLSTATAGATIYYTTNGDTPNNTSAPYSSPFSLGDATVIKAIAYLGSDCSDVSIYNVPTYTTPTINFDNSTSQVTITSEGTVYYNTGDGSQAAPTPSSGTLYNAPFTVSPPTMVKAIATHAGYLNSDVATKYIQSNDYSQNYLTFNVLTDGTIPWKSIGSGMAKEISYSINDGSWISITAGSNVTISVNAGDVVRFKGLNSTYAMDKNNYSGFNGGTATYNISGNIMSLIYGDNFIGETTMSGTYNFCSLFKQSKAVSAENLILPATSLTECCYRAMFSKCTTLEVAPALPATTLGAYCYYYMFEECAISSAPELPAPTLVSNCYGYMFKGCTSLNYILCLAVDKSASGCLSNWVNGVSSTGTFVKDENATWSSGVSGIPSGWIVNNHLAAPDDPVITCDGEFITITCQTYGASIYYRLGQTGSYSLYSTPIVIHENTVVEAYAVKYELQSNIVSENCIANKSYRFVGMEITPGPLYYGNDGYEIKECWNHDSYNSIYGKTVGSTYFNFIELGQLFESSVFSTSDGDIEKVLDPLDGWRVPTNAEWASILGTTRSGSTVNGSSNKHYAMIQLTGVTHANADTPSGLLIFPDGETITGVALSHMDNTTTNTDITESQLNDYLSQGCIFLPGSGYYDGSLQTWDNGHYYWSSTENDASTGYDLYFEPSNTISSVDNKDKETYYFPVYLVKDAANEATRLLRTWTYNNNEVELPYSVNAIDGHSASYARGTFNFTTDIKVKESQPTYLWFQHADQSATVYVDDTLVKKHWGGYNAFFVDISDHVHIGTNNIKVTLKNNEGNHLAPCAGDFNFNATLGEVKLISSPVVPDTVYGYDGFHITSTVTAQEATITVKTSVPTSATLTCSIKGDNCNYSSTQTGTGEITFTTTITNPHLWNGTLDPYLYDVTLTIAKDGVVYHKFKRGYGLRFFEYAIDTVNNANSRFLLNGSPYLLRGVCMHNDLEGKANALTAADIDNDFEILKELGCNFVRLAHYPHPKEVYDWCDKLGIIVQTEVPWVNNAQSTQPSDYYSHLEGQYKDMVNQHYNHPSILFWGLSNETTSNDRNFIKDKINGYITLIKNLDSSRWVGYVMSHSVDNPSGYYNDPDADWLGCNIYAGWYIDQNSNNPTNRLNTRLNNTLTRLGKPLAFSEYGCGGTQSCHSDDFMATTTRGNHERHDIEYQMWLHEGHIAAIKNFPQLLFTSQWQLFDIAVSNRQEGYKVCPDGETVFDNNELKRLNNKGLVERDHKTKKDPFYLYKAWWNQTDKFVHICGKDYEKLTNRVIKCYTNDGSVLRLFVNDEEIQTATVVDNIATFEARDFNPGDVIRVNGATTNDTFTFTDYSEEYIFTTNGNWNVAANWSPAVPAAARNVTINAACTIPATYTAQANNITIGENGSLTIADGGQLYHNNEGVVATVQKTITAYTIAQPNGEYKANGWYLIGYSFAEDGAIAEMDNLLENDYDLYYYEEPTYYWKNHKNTNNNFTELDAARGYLYANNADITIGLKGILEASNAMVSLPLNYTDGIPLAGFNLVGNPFAHNVTAFSGNNVSDEVYRMNDTKDNLMVDNITTTNPLKPSEGFFVKAMGNNASITFNSCAKGENAKHGHIVLEISENDKIVDRLNVKNEGEPLEKLNLRKNGTKIFAMHDNQEMAVVPIQGNEQAIYFKAAKNGTYTISLSTENTTLHYLHLIDNKMGNDVDLLQTPSYSFEAKTTDYSSRFKLVFVCGDANDDNDPSTSSGTQVE